MTVKFCKVMFPLTLTKSPDNPFKVFNIHRNINFSLLFLLKLYKMILLSVIYVRTSNFSERN